MLPHQIAFAGAVDIVDAFDLPVQIGNLVDAKEYRVEDVRSAEHPYSEPPFRLMLPDEISKPIAIQIPAAHCAPFQVRHVAYIQKCCAADVPSVEVPRRQPAVRDVLLQEVRTPITIHIRLTETAPLGDRDDSTSHGHGAV